MDVQYMPQTSKKVVSCKKGLEDGRGLLEGQEGRWGHFKPFFPNSQCILEKKSSGSLHRYSVCRFKSQPYQRATSQARPRAPAFQTMHMPRDGALSDRLLFIYSHWEKPMCIMWNEPTPTSGFPRSLMSYNQQAGYLGNPLGGVGSFHIIHIGENHHTNSRIKYLCITGVKSG